MNFFNKRYTVFILVFASFGLKAQQLDSLTLDTLRDAEFKLMGLGHHMISTFDEKARLTSGRNFLITLSRTLRINGSYYYRFDSLKSVSILYSPDNIFRIITWNIALNDESFHYYGVIQLNPEYMKKIKDTTNLRPFYPLIDRSAFIRNPLDTVVSADHWWGATYYSIVPVNDKQRTYYTLIGWNGAKALSNKKVVDALYFENNKPKFGAPIFDMKQERLLKRMVFEFNNTATMTLRYEPKRKYLIYESIVPPRPQDYGHPETYLPDGTYDYMIFKNGIWEKQPGMLKDFDLR